MQTTTLPHTGDERQSLLSGSSTANVGHGYGSISPSSDNNAVATPNVFEWQENLRKELKEEGEASKKYTITVDVNESAEVERNLGPIKEGDQLTKFEIIVKFSERLQGERRASFFENIIGALSLKDLLAAMDKHQNDMEYREFLKLYLEQLITFAVNHREQVYNFILNKEILKAAKPRDNGYVENISQSLQYLHSNLRYAGIRGLVEPSLKEIFNELFCSPGYEWRDWCELTKIFTIVGLVRPTVPPQASQVSLAQQEVKASPNAEGISIGGFFENTKFDFRGYDVFVQYFPAGHQFKAPQESTTAVQVALSSATQPQQTASQQRDPTLDLGKAAAAARDAGHPYGANFFLNVVKHLPLEEIFATMQAVGSKSHANTEERARIDNTRYFLENCLHGIVDWYCLAHQTSADVHYDKYGKPTCLDPNLQTQMQVLQTWYLRTIDGEDVVKNFLKNIFADLKRYPSLKIGYIRDHFF